MNTKKQMMERDTYKETVVWHGARHCYHKYKHKKLGTKATHEAKRINIKK